MKPNLKFLQKVADGKVYPYADYTPSHGRVDRFRGGEVTAQKHAEAGFVTIKHPPSVLRRGSVTLTDAGRAALAQSSQ